jgi:hypothetical protein
MESSFATISVRFDEIFANFPVRPVAWLLRFLVQPFGPGRRGPSDHITDACAEIISNPCPARDRLTTDLFHPPAAETENGIALLEIAFAKTVAVQPLRDRMRAARARDIDQALAQRTITVEDAAKLKDAAEAVAAAIAVNDFAPEELTSRGAAHQGDVSSQATSRTTILPASTPAPSSHPSVGRPLTPGPDPSLTTVPDPSTPAQASPPQQAAPTQQYPAPTTAPAGSTPAASDQPADQITPPDQAPAPTVQPASTPVPLSHQELEQLPAPEPVQALPPPAASDGVIPLPPPPSAEAAE